MEKRLLLAVILMTAVILITNKMFPPPEVPQTAAPATADSLAVPAPPAAAPLPGAGPVSAAASVDTFSGESDLYRYSFSSRGGEIVRAELREYPSYTVDGSSVQLVPGSARFFTQRLAIGPDTIDLRTLPFTATRTPGSAGEPG